MATVLEKPILLDETGQDIVSKLEEIKSAITTSGDFTPVQIKITTPPVKRTYTSGEELDLTGMVVTLIASNGITYDVTASCTTNPVEGTAITGDTDVVVSFYWARDNITFTATQKVFIKSLQSIAITTPPAHTDFYTGQALELDGIVITANYRGGITEDVTNSCTFNPALETHLTIDDTEIVISYTEGSVTKTTTQEIRVVPVYGVEWDGTASSAWTRTEGAAEFEDPIPYVPVQGSLSYTVFSPFDNIMPWSGMQIVEDAEAGTLVSIPKFYYKLSQNDGVGLKVQISNEPLDGFHVSPAHMDRGDGKGERDVIYVGKYHCSSVDYKSRSGDLPKANVTRATARTNIHNLGNTIWQYDVATMFTIWLLYLVEFADWNSQDKIGRGGKQTSTSETVPFNMGYTDSMPYHTGTIETSRALYGGTQYRNIEGLWDNVYDWVDGCYGDNSNLYVILNPANNSDSSGGFLIGNLQNGYPSALSVKNVENTFEMFISSAGNGSSSTYLCDSWLTNTAPCIYTGGQYVPNLFQGLFCIGNEVAGYGQSNIGCRLIKLP